MSAGPAALEHLSIDGSEGPLQAIVEDPKLPGEGYAVICHPHPLHGGTMDNKVVFTLARAFRETGVPTLRFNFRGVGSSAGTYDHGNGETADAAAAASYGALRWPGRRLMLAGFSFGAFVAMRLALERDASRLITVAPPVDRMDFSALAAPNCPWLVIQGDMDELVDPQRVVVWAGSRTPPPKLLVMPGVGHFFHGHLPQLRQAVVDAIRSG